jgi:hypothetical protein
MTDMIERVALAMQEACEGPAGELEVGGYARPHECYVKSARAAIEAMREPTPDALRIFEALVDSQCHDQTLEDGWRMMIDAALAQSVGTGNGKD